MSKKSDLKTAMDSLQVRKPLRLSSRTPIFSPPIPTSVENPTQVENPSPVAVATPVEEATQVGNSTLVPDQTEVEKETQVEFPTQVPLPATVDLLTEVTNQTPVTLPTMVDFQTEVADPTEVEDKTSVQNQTPVKKKTQEETETQVGKLSQVQSKTPVRQETRVQFPTRVEKKPQERKSASREDASQEGEGDAPGAVRRMTEQDSSVQLEAQAEGKLDRGYTRVPNAVLMRLVAGEFTRNEIKLALLIARFTISYQRKRAPLSKAVLERQTGLRGPAVLEALSGLVAKGLVEKIKGDQHRPNLLGLILPEGWDIAQKTAESTLVESPTQAAQQTQVDNSTTAWVEKPTGAGVGKPTYLKDNERYLNINSLSELPEKLREYFSELMPAKKRESEWLAFRELCSEYSVVDIEESFAIVQSRGVTASHDGNKVIQRCHSPMAFLSKAIGSVLEEMQTNRAKALERSQRERREAEEKRRQEELEAEESRRWAEMERAFQQAFPDEEIQRAAITELCNGLPFRPQSEAGRIFAIEKWWNELNDFKKV